ncbi:MAG: 3-isopropylmalate dehydratase small subunit [Sphingomonadaceae bacterium]
MKLIGRVWKYGPNVDTDVIIPARYLTEFRPAELAKHCMEDLDTSFAMEVRPGDIIVAGRSFGIGSSREHAPVAIKASGIAAVVAPSFARIFHRNSINVGLPVVECDGIDEDVEKGDEVEVDLSEGTVLNRRTGRLFRASRYPDFMLGIIEAGGLVPYTRERLRA